MTETGTSPPPVSRAAVAFIFFTLMLDVLSMGVVIPVLPKLIEGFMDGAHADAVRIGGMLSLVWALMQFAMAPVQGALSDRFGRRPVILLSCLGLGVDFIFMALAPSLAWLFVGRIISGIMAATFSTATAAVYPEYDQLVADGRIEAQPAVVVPGDALDQEALGYLHANCSHCHNQDRPESDGARCYDPRNDFAKGVRRLSTTTASRMGRSCDQIKVGSAFDRTGNPITVVPEIGRATRRQPGQSEDIQ